MRSYQRGISTLIILIIFLIGGVAIVSAYFIFQQQKIKAVNSFEECAALFAVMESYPAQCNTPDGRNFVQQISEEEKEKIKPLVQIESSDNNDISDWLPFQTKVPFTFRYPPTWSLEFLQSDGEKQGVHIQGKEGEIYMYWGSGFGGACEEFNMKPLQLKSETLIVCYEKNTNGSENWRGISKQISDKVGFDATAHVNKPAEKNRAIILKIFSTLSFN